nr:class D sortase [Acutalibacter muris]
MKKKLSAILSAVLLCALCVAPASALEYSIDGADDYLFGRPTSDDTIYEWENPNVDRSKNTALIPPGFGTPTSYLPGSGEYLTPNLVPGALSGGLVNQVGSVGNPNGGTSTNATGSGYPATDSSVSVDGSGFPTVSGGSSTGGQTVGFTEVTSGLYYANGSLGTLAIPSIGLTVGVYEGTDSAALLKGAGHFENTSIWNGNVPIAGHNRGVRNDFGKIHTLKSGDLITFTTVLGTRTYAVSSVTKVDVTDTSGLASTAENCITLYTCVEDQPAYRWCVRGVEQTM